MWLAAHASKEWPQEAQQKAKQTTQKGDSSYRKSKFELIRVEAEYPMTTHISQRFPSSQQLLNMFKLHRDLIVVWPWCNPPCFSFGIRQARERQRKLES